MRLQDQVAIVTGSAAGVGRATAIMLAKEGASVVVNYTKSEAEAKEVASAIEELGRKVLLVRADVSDDQQVKEMVKRTVETFGRLDILVNSAGTTVMVPFRNMDGLTEESWDRVFDVNVKGVFFSSRAAANVMLEKGGGCIVNVSSTAGQKGSGSSIAYAASKAAVNSMTRTMAIGLAPTIRVNAVAPSFIDTRWNAPRPELVPKFAERSPLKRVAKAEDVAEVVVSLVTSAAFVTGQIVTVDGGLYLA